MATVRVRYDNSFVTVEFPVTNPTEATLRQCSLTFDELPDLIAIDSVDKAVGTWNDEDLVWNGFSLKPGETQILYVKFDIEDIDDEGGFYINAVLENAYSGLNPAATTIALNVIKEEDEPISRTIKLTATQSGTDNPSNNIHFNGFQVTPAWLRTGEGVYTLTMTGSFYNNLTIWTVTQVGQPTAVKYTLERTSNDVLTLRTFASNGDPDDLDGSLHIVIEVFND